MKKDDTKYITLSTLKERGWTEKLIKEYLPVPHKMVKNPHYKTAAPMKLYDEEKVIYLEKNIKYIKEYIENTLEKRENIRIKIKEIKDEEQRKFSEVYSLIKTRDFSFKETKEDVLSAIKSLEAAKLKRLFIIISNKEDIYAILNKRYLELYLYDRYFFVKAQEEIENLKNEFGEEFKDVHFKIAFNALKKVQKEKLKEFGFTKSIEEEVDEIIKGKDFSFNESLEDINKWSEENKSEIKSIGAYFENKISIILQNLIDEFTPMFISLKQIEAIKKNLRKEKEKKLLEWKIFHYGVIEFKFDLTSEEVFLKVKKQYGLSEENMLNEKIVKKHKNSYLEIVFMNEIKKLKEDGVVIEKKVIQNGLYFFKQFVGNIK